MSAEKQIDSSEIYQHLWSSLKEGLKNQLDDKSVLDLKNRLMESTKDSEEIVDKQIYVSTAILKELYMNMNAMEDKMLTPFKNDEQ